MSGFRQRIQEWDDMYNDLPRKVFLIVLIIVSACVILNILPFTWPFVLGLLFAALMNPAC